jgi:hypothetical protein
VEISRMHQEDQLLCEVEIRHRVEVVPEEEVGGLELNDTRHRGMLGLNHISSGGVEKKHKLSGSSSFACILFQWALLVMT